MAQKKKSKSKSNAADPETHPAAALDDERCLETMRAALRSLVLGDPFEPPADGPTRRKLRAFIDSFDG